jgi:uncharacterized membrane protein YfcA
LDLTWPVIAHLLVGAVLGGFVNGLTGFGTALTAMPVWIQVMSPPAAASLAAAAGVAGQLPTLHMFWRAMDLRRIGPFIIAGLVGVPIGTLLLPLLEPRSFKLGVGIVLIVYCGFQLLAARLATRISTDRQPLGDVLIGLGGGVLSGIAGLSGPLPIAWATFKPWTRDQKRALYQAFNTVILSATVCSSTIAGLLPPGFWYILLLTIPATFAGVWLGAVLYRRLDDRRFDRLVVMLLLLTGVSLVASNL